MWSRYWRIVGVVLEKICIFRQTSLKKTCIVLPWYRGRYLWLYQITNKCDLVVLSEYVVKWITWDCFQRTVYIPRLVFMLCFYRIFKLRMFFTLPCAYIKDERTTELRYVSLLSDKRVDQHVLIYVSLSYKMAVVCYGPWLTPLSQSVVVFPVFTPAPKFSVGWRRRDGVINFLSVVTLHQSNPGPLVLNAILNVTPETPILNLFLPCWSLHPCTVTSDASKPVPQLYTVVVMVCVFEITTAIDWE